MSTTLSEKESKDLLAAYGVPVVADRVVSSASAAAQAADGIGYPVVVKLVGPSIAHKTERGLVRLHLADHTRVAEAAGALLAAATPADGDVAVLVAPMVAGTRELIAGLVRDASFGPTVMLGVGGVLAEALRDVVFGPAPLDAATACEMIDDLRSQALLGPFRGEAAVDRDRLAGLLVALGRLGAERADVVSVDVNPLIIDGAGAVIAVDALVEIGDPSAGASNAARRVRDLTPLFEPRGVVVTGASTHPGKFGFVALHNLLAAGYAGDVFATNLDGEVVLGVQTLTDLDQLPDGAAELAFVCTPAAANAEVLRACARNGVRAAFVTSAGYGEAGETGRSAQADLVALADELGIVLAGPNGQGLVSTPVKLCAQIVAPYPPTGSIAVASQSGNLVSSFLNLARASGVGISRAVSAGNAAAVGVADYLEYFADDSATTVALAYLESVGDGAELMRRMGDVARAKPLVVVKGGATGGGARAAASHTGALAADDAIFDGACRAFGITRASGVEEAFDAAATFATQPLPKGPNVVVVTTAGGWGVLSADAIGRDRDLQLIDLPDDLCAAIDAHLPPRWSRSNPIDCAGGETRDTIPIVLALAAEHPAVDAVVFLGLGIQSNQARLMREGSFHPDHGLERIVAYHERQDQRFAEAAIEVRERTGKPVLCATELAVADPANPGPATLRARGEFVHPSGERAVAALGHLYRRALFLQRRGLGPGRAR